MFQLRIELQESLLPIVLCCESALHIMGMLLGFDSYTKCTSYLVQVILQCFTKNMHLPIVLCCDMNVYIPTKFNHDNRL